MSTFWQNLHRLAFGQLFNGGHISDVAEAIAADTTPVPAARRKEDAASEYGHRAPHTQIIALH